MCIAFSIIERVYWYLRVILSSMFAGESSYVSFLRSSFSLYSLCRVFWEWDDWPSLRRSRSLFLLSLHSLLMWLHFMLDLRGSSLLFVFFASPSSSFLFLIHHPHLTLCHFLTATLIPSLTLPVHHPYTSRYQIIFLLCLIIDIIFTLGTFKSMAHELFYTCCILYMRAWVFDHWVFRPSFPSFLLSYHPGLCYVLCLKTTLRPWHQMSFSIAPTWIGV